MACPRLCVPFRAVNIALGGGRGCFFSHWPVLFARACVLHSAASHTACAVRRNLLSPQWTVALTRQTSQDFARAIRIDLAQQKTLASVASSRRIRPRGRLAARPNCVFSPSLRRHSSQIAHPGQLRVLWSQPKVCLEPLFWVYLRLNQTKTKPCSISRDRFCQLFNCPRVLRPAGPWRALMGPAGAPCRGPYRGPWRGWAGGVAGGRPGGRAGSKGPGEPREARGKPGEAKGGPAGPGGGSGSPGRRPGVARAPGGRSGEAPAGPGRPCRGGREGPGGPGEARGGPGGPREPGGPSRVPCTQFGARRAFSRGRRAQLPQLGYNSSQNSLAGPHNSYNLKNSKKRIIIPSLNF